MHRRPRGAGLLIGIRSSIVYVYVLPQNGGGKKINKQRSSSDEQNVQGEDEPQRKSL